LKSNPISVNHPDAATSDIPILFAALFIQIVALHPDDQLWRVLDTFCATKANGTGLGFTIARRRQNVW
jgi:hypothetical protein